MTENKEILDLIERKNFKNFWYSFDYLTQAGYSEKDALWHSVKFFGEDKIFDQVAYVRLRQGMNLIDIHHSNKLEKHFVIGFNDNVGLDSLFKTYHKWLAKNIRNKPQYGIESLCESMVFKYLSEPMLRYLLTVSHRYYGFDAFRVKAEENDVIDTIIPDTNSFVGTMQDVHKQMLDIVGIPAHLLGENTKTRII